MQRCFFCGSPLQLVHVHGHYQCAHCGTNAMPCCDGDNCHTSLITNPAEVSVNGSGANLQAGLDNLNNDHPNP